MEDSLHSKRSWILKAFLFPQLAFATRWFIDAVRCVETCHTHCGRALWSGLALGLCEVMFAALLLGAAGAALVALCVMTQSHLEWRGLATARSWLRTRDPDVAVRRIVVMLSVAVGALAYFAVSKLIIELAVTQIARPAHVSLAVVASQALLAFAFGALSRTFVALSKRLLDLALSVPRVGPALFATPRRCARTLAVGALALCIGYLVHYRGLLAYLPWREAGWWCGAALISSGLVGLVSLLSPRGGYALGVATMMMVTASAFASTLVDTNDRVTHDVATRLPSERTALRLLLWAADFDRDGHLSVLGGGDCAAWNPGVHPGALEIPNDGIDEDCDGEESSASNYALKASAQFEVPRDVPSRPPIVLITVDAFAAAHVGRTTPRGNVTPELDGLAQRAAVFSSCYAQGPSTRLSVPSMFTSQWDSQAPGRLKGRHPFPLSTSVQTLGELLSSAGYETSAVLSDDYFTPERWRGITRGFGTLSRTPLNGEDHNAAAVTDAALALLDAPSSRPKFVWAHYFDAHPPHDPVAGFVGYGPKESDRYDAELTLVDRELGRLVRQVEARTHETAIIVITGDHGLDFASPRHATFSYGYDLSSAVLHVPLLVLAPFVPAHRFDHLVSTMDVMPTLANLVRAVPRNALYGQSLLPELLHGTTQRPQLLFHEMFLLERQWDHEDPLTLASVRSEHLHLIHDREHDRYELYDFRRDPLEAVDLSSAPEEASAFAALRGVLQDFLYAAHRSGAATSAQR